MLKMLLLSSRLGQPQCHAKLARILPFPACYSDFETKLQQVNIQPGNVTFTFTADLGKTSKQEKLFNLGIARKWG